MSSPSTFNDPGAGTSPISVSTALETGSVPGPQLILETARRLMGRKVAA